jgi:hypothetical protein
LLEVPDVITFASNNRTLVNRRLSASVLLITLFLLFRNRHFKNLKMTSPIQVQILFKNFYLDLYVSEVTSQSFYHALSYK